MARRPPLGSGRDRPELGRFPAVVLAYGIIIDAGVPFIAATTLLATLPMLVAFRFFEGFLRQQREGR